VRRGRSLTDGGPERPNTSGMTKASAEYEMKLWRKARKKYTDSLLSLKAKVRKSLERDNDDNNHYDDDIKYLRVITDIFRQMTAVEAEPMIVGHNYPSKEILLMRIAEEANLHNVEAATIRSCDKRVYFQGRAGATFTVKARHSETKNWTVKEYVHWTVPALPRMDNLDEVNKEDDDGENNEEKDNDDEEEKDDNEDFYSDDPDDFEDGDDDGEDGDDFIGEEGGVMVMESPRPTKGARGRPHPNTDLLSRAGGLCPSSNSTLLSIQTFLIRSVPICCACMLGLIFLPKYYYKEQKRHVGSNSLGTQVRMPSTPRQC
jgi:hypothetical protein